MADTQRVISDYSNDIDQKEINLLDKKKEVFAFIETDHNSDASKEWIKNLRTSETDLDFLMKELLRLKAEASFAEAASALCDRTRNLYSYTRDMNEVLTADYEERKGQEKKMDVVRDIGIFFAIVSAFVGSVKAGVGDGAVTVNQAAEIGGVVGGATLAHKPLTRLFIATGKAVCASPKKIVEAAKLIGGAPKKIKDSFTVYYIRERTKETLGQVKNRALSFSKGRHPEP